MIPPGEIARLAHRLGLGDKTIEKDYVLTWVLLAIANSPLRDRLAFKGGTAIKKVYEPDYRFSEDLDFTLLDDVSNDDLIAEIENLFPWLRREVNVTLAVRRVETHQTGNPALYLNYIGPLRGDLSSRFFKDTVGELSGRVRFATGLTTTIIAYE
ncbi:MAG: nucleotidyl transferase AbiEii/AbiGii toxin family protein [Anaerolineae bacterium]|nr:nucleotidyl transferase AbiEii/AbiGii toxin family protein [Anaerolineae bacterium]